LILGACRTKVKRKSVNRCASQPNNVNQLQTDRTFASLSGFSKICGGPQGQMWKYLQPLYRERHTISATQTKRGNPPFQVALLQRVQQRRENPGTAGADGMSKCDRASVDIHTSRIHPQFASTAIS